MALLRRLFYRKPPDGVFEICERVYVFDCCFTTDASKEENYKVYISGIVGQLQEHLPDAAFLVFNFHDGSAQSQMTEILSEYDITIMDYPRQFEDCPVLTMETIHHFLRSTESWLGLGQNNVLLMHCERGGWPVLAFMLAALLIYRKHYTGERRTLDMVYRQSRVELLHLGSPLNPMPSQLRYLQYISRRNVASEWPPLDRALTLDCVIFRFIPNFDGDGGCRPMFRIYGQDPFLVNDRTTKVLYSNPKQSKTIRAYKQAECELVKIDISCRIQGDVVIECTDLHDDMEHEQMMFRVMFNTAFIRSNILMLNRDELDVLWDVKDQFPNDFRVEMLFSEMDDVTSIILGGLSCFEDKEGLPMEAFSQVQEIFSYVDWLDPKADAALNVLHQLNSSSILHEKCDTDSLLPKQIQENNMSSAVQSLASTKPAPDASDNQKGSKPLDGRRPDQADSKTQKTLQPPSLKPIKSFTQVQDILSQVASARSSDSTVTKPQDIHTAERPPTSHSDIVSQQKAEPPKLTPMEAFVRVTEIFNRIDSPKKSQDTPFSKQDAKPKDTHTALQAPIPEPCLPTPASPKAAKSISVAPPPTPPPAPPLQPIAAVTTPPPPSPSLQPQHTSLPKSKDPLCQPSSPGRLPPPSSPKTKVASPSQSYPAIPLKENTDATSKPPPPAPPPIRSGQAASTGNSSSFPMPPSPRKAPPPPSSSLLGKVTSVPSAPPPPAPLAAGGSKARAPPPPPLSSGSNAKSRASRATSMKENQKKLKPLHWMKLSRAVQGSLWAEAEKISEEIKAPEINISELENLFAAAVPASDHGKKATAPGPVAPKKFEKLQLIDHRRAYNCEIMLTKVKVPLHELMNSVLALEDTALDPDQVENIIKFCPTKEEIELLKGYKGDKEKLGKCEQFMSELIKVPRVESKLRVFSFKIQFSSQVSDLRKSLNALNSAAEEIRNSVKLKRVMQTILSLGNALNQGTARGAAVGFKLDSLLKLIDTRARNNKMTLMHYLCKVLAEQLPEVLDFHKDLPSLEPASKIQLNILAEEMQAVSKGLEKIVQELSTSESDGPISDNFRKTLMEFLRFAEAEVRALASLYSIVGRNVDALILYFGEDPAKCPFEKVISTLLNFVKMFAKSHDENSKQSELEKKKAAEDEKVKMGSSKQSERVLCTPIKNGDVK